MTVSQAEYDRRVTELLESNNATLERARKAEMETANLRLLVRRLCLHLPKGDAVKEQAQDYLRRTFKAADVLREDEGDFITPPQCNRGAA